MKLNIDNNQKGMVFNRDFEVFVQQNNLLDFDTVMTFKDGEVVKHAVPERKTDATAGLFMDCRFQSG